MALPTETIVVSASTAESLILTADAHYDLTVAADMAVSVAETDAIAFQAGAEANDAALSIDGTVTVQSTSGTARHNAISFAGQNAVTMQIADTGLVRNQGALGSAISLVGGQALSMTNAGRIEGQTALYVEDVVDFALDNTGGITGLGRAGVEVMMAMNATESVRLDNQGSITGRDTAVLLKMWGMSGLEINNSGHISTSATKEQGSSDALGAYGWAGRANIVNSGSITVNDGIALALEGTSAATDRLHLNNSGQIVGNVILEKSTDVVINSGSIAGWLVLLDGDDRYVTTGLGRVLEGVLAGDGADTVRGGRGVDVLLGEHGADLLRGGNGDDLLVGGEDDDLLKGGHGDDELNGDAGSDVLRGDTGRDLLLDASGDNFLYGGAGIDTIQGGEGNDLLNGGAGADELYGRDGNDTMLGGAGADVLVARDGEHVLRGGAGADTLSSGFGIETLTGGSDADLFQFIRSSIPSEGAVVTDFENGVDQLHFAMDSDGATEFGFEDISLYARQVGDHVVLDLTGLGFGRVVLRDMALAELDATDFRMNVEIL